VGGAVAGGFVVGGAVAGGFVVGGAVAGGRVVAGGNSQAQSSLYLMHSLPVQDEQHGMVFSKPVGLNVPLDTAVSSVENNL
jgi:hypothetical protein